ncbi:MAG TPA: universal stress protein [Pyrinomonadaceae bacterium]|nr:universal stress protein [Pyrinomonadaceae bacterium]
MSNSFKLLIGYDGSSFADAVLDDLGTAGLPDSGVHVTVITVTDAWELPDLLDRVSPVTGRSRADRTELIREHLEDLVQRTGAMASAAADRLSDAFPAWNVETAALTGKPGVEMIRFADEWKPDLIAMGSHGRGFIGRAVLGSVSMKVLHEAQASVRIVRKNEGRRAGPQRVIVALDGSECSDVVVDNVVGRTWPADTQFRLVTADDAPARRPETSVLDAVREGHKDSPEAEAWVERVLSGPLRRFEEAGLRADQICRWAAAKSLILDQADEWNADCIFIGARGVGRVSRMFLGSVSAAVAARARCTVEVIRDTGNA